MDRIVLYLVVLSLFLTPLLAETNLNTNCVNNAECAFCVEYGYNCYCNPQTSTCFSQETAASTPSSTTSVTSPAASASSGTILSTSSSTPFSIPVSTASLTGLQMEVRSVQQKVAALETEYQAVQQKLLDIESTVTQVSSSLTTVTTEQNQVKEEMQTGIKSVSTGLAGLQQNIEQTQSEVQTLQAEVADQPTTTKIILVVFFVLIIIATFIGLIYFMENRRGQVKPHLRQDIVQYITSHIKAGRKFPHIKENLLKAGWSPDDIAWAYRETVQKNYRGYVEKKTTSSSASRPGFFAKLVQNKNYDYNKTFFIAGFSILLIIGIFFLLRGITGQAIHFQSEIELDAAVKDALTRLIDENEFYPLIDTVKLCVEVQDLDKRVYYSVTKTPVSHTVEKPLLSCTRDVGYDLSVLFTNWNAFNIVLKKPTCENFKNVHRLVDGERGMYILPSKYIFPGFKKNPFADPTPYCKVLLPCLTAEELAQIGVNC